MLHFCFGGQDSHDVTVFTNSYLHRDNNIIVVRSIYYSCIYVFRPQNAVVMLMNAQNAVENCVTLTPPHDSSIPSKRVLMCIRSNSCISYDHGSKLAHANLKH